MNPDTLPSHPDCQPQSQTKLMQQVPDFDQEHARACIASNFLQQHWALASASLTAEWQQTHFRNALDRDGLAQRLEAALAQPDNRFDKQSADSPDDHAGHAAGKVTRMTEAQWMQGARQCRRLLMMRWIWQDANGLITLDQLTRELSDFADVCIDLASRFAYSQLQPRYGTPRSETSEPQQLIVIGMGKLGAYELNLSSDIDLIFCYDESGETDAVPDPSLVTATVTRCRRISVQEFMIQWGQLLIRLLDQPTVDGFVWRVDMRLRPWGDGSPLAISHAALERYLEQHGRDWERYAWIKARAITGAEVGQAILDMARPFVYRRYVDYSVFESLREMKQMIEREVARKQGMHNVKLSAGGIREIEFIVQSYQLIYGGQLQALQVRPCLTALHLLVDYELMDAETALMLEDAYRFLRRIEHAIQAMDDQQTQTLPANPAVLDRIASVSGEVDGAQFLDKLGKLAERVRSVFNQNIGPSPTEENTDSSNSLSNIKDNINESTTRKMEEFKQSKAVKKLPMDAARRLEQFWPALTEALARCDDSELTLSRVLPLIEAVLRRSVYLVMLLETRGALPRLLRMLTVSPWIAEELTRYPVLLDEFLGNDDAGLPTPEELQNQLRLSPLRIEPDDIEGQMQALRLFKKSQVLSVAVSDVLAERPLMKVSDALTWIAETVLQQAIALVLQPIVSRHGWPQRQSGQRADLAHTGLAVIGYGKLGGIELGYGSDLDLVLVHDYDGQVETDGQKPISGQEFAVIFVRKLMALLTTQTLDGRVYEIDLRLRPSGDAGMLINSVSGLQHYLEQDAWLWEKQALVRARAVAGDDATMQQFETLRSLVLQQPREVAPMRDELVAMRQKMIDHLASPPERQRQGLFHLKHDIGGMVDIEFMAQYGVLAHAASVPALTRWSDNVRILADLAQWGILSAAEATFLTNTYLALRAQSHRQALAQSEPVEIATDWQPLRDGVVAIWDRWLGRPLQPRGHLAAAD